MGNAGVSEDNPFEKSVAESGRKVRRRTEESVLLPELVTVREQMVRWAPEARSRAANEKAPATSCDIAGANWRRGDLNP